MKIAYIILFTHRVVGIDRKIERQARALAASNITEVDVFFIQPFESKRAGNVTYVKIPYRPFPLSYYRYLFRRYDLIERAIDLARYDYIVLRYPSADPSGVEFVQKHRVITEHNSDELSQMAGNVADPHLSPPMRAVKKLRFALERKHGGGILRECRGFIGVTDEICRAELARVEDRKLPTCTIPNGINVGEIEQVGFRPFDGKRLDLLMIVSNSAPWHGIDRVAGSLARYRGPVDVRLHVVGGVSNRERERICGLYRGAEFHGTLSGAHLRDAMRDKNLGISTMALYRKGMQQACALKTREYAAAGLPFVLGYHDPDLQHASPGRPFFKLFPNDRSVLDTDELIEFATQVSAGDGPRTLPDHMRAYAGTHMDWRIKMRAYPEFVRLVAESGDGHGVHQVSDLHRLT